MKTAAGTVSGTLVWSSGGSRPQETASTVGENSEGLSVCSDGLVLFYFGRTFISRCHEKLSRIT